MEENANVAVGQNVMHSKVGAMRPQIFEFDSNFIRVTVVDGEYLFNASDIAIALGYTNPMKAIRDHCKGVNELFTPSGGGVQKSKFIKQPDVFRLIMRSKMDQAEQFQDWIFEEVLPALAKHGSYSVDGRGLEDRVRELEKALKIRGDVGGRMVGIGKGSAGVTEDEVGLVRGFLEEKGYERCGYRMDLPVASVLYEEFVDWCDDVDLVSQRVFARVLKGELGVKWKRIGRGVVYYICPVMLLEEEF